MTNQLKKLIEESHATSEIKRSLVSGDTLDHNLLLQWYQSSAESTSLLNVLQMTRLVLPRVLQEDPTPKTPEYEAMMAKLRLKQAEVEYQRLVRPKPEYETLHETDFTSMPLAAQQAKEVKNQITTIINVLVSVASVAYAAWYWTGSSWGLDPVWRVLFMVLAGLLVLIAEVVVYMGYIRRVDEARTRERAKKEVKKVVERI